MRGADFLLIALTITSAANVGIAQERPFRESVSIPVDAEVAKSLRMIRDQWDNGPEVGTLSALVELCDAHGDQLVLRDRGVAGGAARFVRLQALADELVAGLTPELRAHYRQRIDSFADPWWKAWQDSGDVRMLERLVNRARFSSWGDRAIDAAAQWHWDRGDFTAARRLWQRVIPVDVADGDAALSPAAIAARLILCDIASQRRETVPDALTKFAEQYPTATGTLGGRTDRWTVLLPDFWEKSQQWQPIQTQEDITTFAGDFTRQHVAPKSLDVGGELWSASLPNPRLPSGSRNVVFPPPLPLAFHPAVLDDLVIINDGRQIHARNLYSGKPYWDAGHEDGDVIYPVVADPSPMMPVRPVAGQAQWTVTIAQGRVYARMGSAVTTPAATEFRDLPAELVCLDIAQGEGQLLWKQTADDLAPAAGELPVWRWEGSPVVEGGRVYSVLSRRRPQLEWSIACLDAESGLMLWQRPIGITRPTPPDHENRASSLLLTSGGGQLFLSTGWGAVVAVDPRDGAVNWAVTYESHAATTGNLGAVPLQYFDGRIYAVLLDGDRLASLDATTGRFVWSRPLTEPLQEILGVAGGRLIVSGRSLWGFDAETGGLVWSVPATEPDDWGYGRGALAGDHVLWTTHDALWFVDQRTGTLLRVHPLQNIDAPRSGGNVVVSHGVMLIAGADRITAYGEYARLREELEQPLSDHRQELRRDMKLAEIAWSTGATTQAGELWDRVRTAAASTMEAEKRRATARVSLLPGRRPPRPIVRNAPRIPVTPVATVSKTVPPVDAASLPSSYWRRVVHRRLDGDTHAQFPKVMPGDHPVGIVLDGTSLALWKPAESEEHALAQAVQRVVWSGQWAEWFVVVTDDEILIFDRDSTSLRHRLPRPAWTSACMDWVIHPQGLLMLAPSREVALLDLAASDWRWRRTAETRGWQQCIGWNADCIAVHPLGFAGAEIWRAETGATLRREHPRTAPWKVAPVFSGEGEDYFVVTEDDRLMHRSTTVDRQWEFAGLIAQTHAPPWVFLDGDDVFAVIDGTRLVRIARSSGWPRWSTVVADVPLRMPAEQCALANRTCFTASGGVLRAVDLDDGKTLWTALDAADSSAMMRGWLDDRADVLAVVPHGNVTKAVVDRVTLYSTTTGRPIQTLKLPCSTARLELASLGSHQIAILTDRDVLIYQR